MKSALIAGICIGVIPAALLAQEHFDSPQAAADALVQAAAANDTAKLNTIFGGPGQQLLTSGNPTQDQAERAEFARLAKQRLQIEPEPSNPNRVLLGVGTEDWPFPVPLVKAADGKWSFDSASGKLEMRARRVGANELDAIEICAGYVQAQQAYAERQYSEGVGAYARTVMSTPGQQDGLYSDRDSTPLVPRGFAEAVWNPSHPNPKPYHGYFFAVIDSQGPSAPGGQHSYVINNRLEGGFGLVAWPAQYGVTGVHTFIVNQDGQIYEKDLGPAVKSEPPVTRYDPDASWTQVDE